MRRAFRIVAAVLGIVAIGFSLPFAVGALLGEADRIHRFHFVAGTLGSGVLLGVSLLACARRPQDLGPFWVALASGVATTIAGIAAGDFVSGGYVIAPILLIVLFVLHPERRSLFAIGGVEGGAAALASDAPQPAAGEPERD